MAISNSVKRNELVVLVSVLAPGTLKSFDFSFR